MRSVQPDDPPTPAKTGHGEPRGVGFARRLRISDGSVQIGHDLPVRHLRYDCLDQLLSVTDLRWIALTRIKFGSDRIISGLCQTTAEILDVLVHAEDLLDHEYGRERSALRRHHAIGRDRP